MAPTAGLRGVGQYNTGCVAKVGHPGLPDDLGRLPKQIGSFNPITTSYFLGRETLGATKRPGMAIRRDRLFGWMMRNSSNAAQYFSLPTNQIIELGAQIEM